MLKSQHSKVTQYLICTSSPLMQSPRPFAESGNSNRFTHKFGFLKVQTIIVDRNPVS